MLIVIGEAEAASGRREEMLEVVRTMATATRPDDGCLSYGFYADVTRPDVIVGLEVWRDRAALDTHMGHNHTAEFIAAVPELVKGEPVMRFYDAAPMQDEAP